jgi:YHS domain-containing protein
VGGPRERLEALLADRAAALDARAVGSIIQAPDRGHHVGEMTVVSVAQGEVALLLEDLACGGRLRAVRHRARGDDASRDLAAEAITLDQQGSARIVEQRIGHGPILGHSGCAWPAGRLVWPTESPIGAGLLSSLGALAANTWSVFHMTIEKDPVCGMDVDTTTSELKLEHDGRTYWFCGKGCLLEFRDDPERFLDPEYQPSM